MVVTGDAAAEWSAGTSAGLLFDTRDNGINAQRGWLASAAFRGFFEVVDHPVNGPARLSTVPMTLSGGPRRFHTQPAPLLGQHNHEVLAELGLTDAEIAELESDGVIGRMPAMHAAT